ncbi:MAG: hypothetical protein ACLFQP_07130 [Halothece sp.]
MLKIRSFISLILVITIFLLTPACSQNNEPTSRFESAQNQTTAVAEDAVKGGELNRYFPKSEDSYQIVYTQEKRGFAQAKLKDDGEELALLSISDIANNPSASNKFKDSSETIKGYPVVNQGSKASAILVRDRYQVKILSRSDNFDEDSRKEWLAKFDLDTLAQL